MGESDPSHPAARPALDPVPYASAPVAAPGPVNYFRFTPREAGWTSVASFGTASVWHRARDLLSQQRIVCRMDADSTQAHSEEERMELLVMASEAEWAREVLRQGIPELVGTVLPAGGFPIQPTQTPVALSAQQTPPLLPELFRQQLSQSATTELARSRLVISPSSGATNPKAPLRVLPVGPVRPAALPGQSAAFTVTLVLAFAALILLIICMVAVCFMPGY